MKPLICSVYMAVAFIQVAAAQDKPQYAASLIPDTLKKEVNSVVREESEILVIKSPGKGKQDVKRVITVLNDKGEEGLVFVQYPDKFVKIDDVEINVYDENGKYQKRYKRKDLEKAADDDGFSLVTDNKILYGKIRADKFPITVEYNYTVNYEGFLEYPDFYPQTANQAIQLSTYSITTESSNKIRYKNYRCNIQPVIKEEGGRITYNWTVKNVPPYLKEPGTGRRDVPRVQISPSQFEMDDYRGDMSSWESFGKWQISLNNQAGKLSDEKIAFYRDLVKNAGSDREKAQILYRHLQENYRYVSIQLGIGGWKPFPADFVEKKKYGDCKALSNFMHTMLNAVGVRSHYAIINAGYNELPVDKDFPQSSFNHVILCIPQPKDTIWLECTSRKQAFGKLGSFTENRNAFIITENGGQIVSTPKSSAEDNIRSTYSLVKLEEDGSGTASIDIKHTGEFIEEADYVLEADEQRRKSYLINYAGFKQPDALKVAKKASSQELYELHYDMSFEKIPDFSAGSKHFLNARLYKFWNDALPKSENRKNDYYLRHPLIQKDSTVYQLPASYVADNLPKPANITFPLGSYQTSYSFDASTHQLVTTTVLRINRHIIPASVYQEALKFFSDVIKEQQQKIVIKKE